MKRIGILTERQRAYGRRICEGIAAFAQEREDWSLSMVEWSDLANPARLRDFDGIIARVFDDAAERALLRGKRPVVDVYCGKTRPKLYQVDQDGQAVGELAARHFLERKFTRFGFCGHNLQRYSNSRQSAFVAFLAKNGFSVEVYSGHDQRPDDFTRSLRNERLAVLPREKISLESWVRALPKPIGVFCAHDLRAWQLLNVCRDCGLNVPKDVAILGVDDDTLICNFTTPTLSSVDPNAFGIGFRAAQVLHAALTDGRCAPSGEITAVPPVGLSARNSTKIYPLEPPWLSDALFLIRQNVASGLTASDVIRQVGLSHTVVETAFRKILGTTIQQEIISARTETAKQLLRETALSVSEIAARCGYSTPQYFCRDFASATRQTPTHWRQALTAP